MEQGNQLLGQVRQRLSEYEALDAKILALAVQNTNLKAQKLAFGPGGESADSLQKSLAALTRSAPPKLRCQLESLAARAILAVREIEVLQAPHIAESKDAAMTGLEKEMDAKFTVARSALDALSPLVEHVSSAEFLSARAALERFQELHAQIIVLSRTNTNVRSLELVLGDGRSLIAACEASLSELQDALAKEGFKATR